MEKFGNSGKNLKLWMEKGLMERQVKSKSFDYAVYTCF